MEVNTNKTNNGDYTNDPLVSSEQLKKPIVDPTSTIDRDELLDDIKKTQAVKAPTNTTADEGVYHLNDTYDSYSKYFGEHNIPVGLSNKDMDYYRADQQSGLAQVGMGLARLPIGVVGKVTEMAGNAVGLADWIAGGVSDLANTGSTNYLGTTDKLFHNAITDMGAKWQEWNNNEFPIYKTQKYVEGNALEKMLTTNYLANDLGDGAQFVIASMLPMAGLKALSLGESIMGSYNAATKATELGKVTTDVMEKAAAGALNTEGASTAAQSLNAWAQAIDRNVLTTYNAVTMATQFGRGAKDQTKQELLQQLGKTEDQLTQSQKDDIEQRAGSVGLKVTAANLPLLLFSEHIMSNIWKTPTPSERLVGLGAESASGASALPDLTWKGYGKTIGEHLLSSFGREGAIVMNSQTAISNYFRDHELGRDDNGVLTGILGNMVKNFTTTEGLSSIITGGLLGLPGAAIRGFKQAKSDHAYLDNLHNSWSNANANIREGINGLFEYDANGNKVKTTDPTDIGIDDGTGNMYKFNREKAQTLIQSLPKTVAQHAMFEWMQAAEHEGKVNPNDFKLTQSLLNDAAIYQYIKEDGGKDVYKAVSKNIMNDNIKRINADTTIPDSEKSAAIDNESKAHTDRINQAELNSRLLAHIDGNEAGFLNLGDSKEAQGYKEMLRGRQYDLLTSMYKYRELVNDPSVDPTYKYDGKLISERKGIQEAIKLVNEGDLHLISDDTFKQLGLDKTQFIDADKAGDPRAKDKVREVLEKRSQSLDYDIKRSTDVLDDMKKEWDVLTDKSEQKRLFDLNTKEWKKREKEAKAATKTKIEETRNQTTDTIFDQLGKTVHNFDNKNTDTLYGKYVDSTVSDPTKATTVKSDYSKFNEFSTYLRTIEHGIENDPTSYIDPTDPTKIKPEGIDKLVKDNPILENINKDKLTSMVHQFLNTDSKTDKIGTAQELDAKTNEVLQMYDKAPIDEEIKNKLNQPIQDYRKQYAGEDENGVPEDLNTTAVGNKQIADAMIKFHDDLQSKLKDSKQLEVTKGTETIRYNSDTDSLLHSNKDDNPIIGFELKDGTKINLVDPNSPYYLGKSDVTLNEIVKGTSDPMDEVAKQYETYFNRQLPLPIRNDLAKIQQQVADMKRQRVSLIGKGKIERIIQNQKLEQLQNDIRKVNKKLVEEAKENTNIVTLPEYDMLKRNNDRAFEMDKRLSYIVETEHTSQQVQGKEYTYDQLDNYTRNFDIKQNVPLSVEIDTEVYPTDNTFENGDKDVPARIQQLVNDIIKSQPKNINELYNKVALTFSKNRLLKDKFIDMLLDEYPDLKREDVEDNEGVHKEFIYDLIHIGIKDTNVDTNPDGVQFWMHKPRKLSGEIRKINGEMKLSQDNPTKLKQLQAIKDEFAKSIDQLRENRTNLIDTLLANQSQQLHVVDKSGGSFGKDLDENGNMINKPITTFENQLNHQVDLYVKVDNNTIHGSKGNMSQDLLDRVKNSTDNGNVLTVVKDLNGNSVPLIVNVNNFDADSANVVVDLMRMKFGVTDVQGVTEFKTTFKGGELKGEFHKVEDLFYKWNPMLRIQSKDVLGSETTEVPDYRLEQLKDEDGKRYIAYGKDGKLYVSTLRVEDSQLTDPQKKELSDFKDWLQKSKRWNVNKDNLGRSDLGITYKGKALDYDQFIKEHAVSTNIKVPENNTNPMDKGRNSVFRFPIFKLDTGSIKPLVVKPELKEGATTIDEIGRQFPMSDIVRDTINTLLEKVGKTEFQVVGKDDVDLQGAHGIYKNGVVKLNKDTLNNTDPSVVPLVVLHETLHPYITQNLSKEQRSRLDTIVSELQPTTGNEHIDKVITAIKNDPKVGVDELLSYTFGDTEFAKHLNNTVGIDPVTNRETTLWDRILNVVKSVIGNVIKGSKLDNIMDILNDNGKVVDKVETKVETPTINPTGQEGEVNNEELDFMLNELPPVPVVPTNRLKLSDIQLASKGLFATFVDESILDKDEKLRIDFYNDIPAGVDKNGKVLPKRSSVPKLLEALAKQKDLEGSLVQANNIRTLIKYHMEDLKNEFESNVTDYRLSLDKSKDKDESNNLARISDHTDEAEDEAVNSSGISDHTTKSMLNDYRDTATSNLKFIIDRMYKKVDDGTGKLVDVRDKTFGFKQLENPSKTWKILVDGLSTAENLDDIFGNIVNGEAQGGKLRAMVNDNPYLRQLFEPETVIKADGTTVVTRRAPFEFTVNGDEIVPVEGSQPKERYVQLAVTFNKLKNQYTKTIVEDIWNPTLQRYETRMRNVNQSESETQTSTINTWTNAFLNSKLHDSTKGEYSQDEAIRIFNKYTALSNELKEANKGKTQILRDEYKVDSPLYKQKVDDILDIFHRLSINVDKKTLDYMVTKTGTDPKMTDGLQNLNHLIEKSGLDHIVNDTVNGIIKRGKEAPVGKLSLEKSNHLTEYAKGRVKNLADAYSKIYPDVVETSISSVDTANYQLYTQHHHMSKIVKDIQNGNYDYINKLAAAPQNKNSVWLQHITKAIENKDFDTLNKIKVNTFNYISNSDSSSDGMQYSDLPEVDQYMQMYGSLFQVSDDGKLMSNREFSPMTFSSRNTWYKYAGLPLGRDNDTVKFITDEKGKSKMQLSPEWINLYRNYIDDELSRGKVALDNARNESIAPHKLVEGYHYVSSLRALNDRLKSKGIDITLEDKDLIKRDGRIIGYTYKGKEYSAGRAGELGIFGSLTKDVMDHGSTSKQVIDKVHIILKTRINDEINKLTELGLIQNKDGLLSNQRLDKNVVSYLSKQYEINGKHNDQTTHQGMLNTISQIVLNHMVGGIETEKLTGIDPVQFKSRTDETKRLSTLTSTKDYLDFSNFIRMLYGKDVIEKRDKNGVPLLDMMVLNDIKRISSGYGQMVDLQKERFMKEGLSEIDAIKKAHSMVDPFIGTNATDGQTVAHPRHTKDALIRLGKWNSNMDSMYQYAQKEGKWADKVGEPNSDPTPDEMAIITKGLDEFNAASHGTGINPLKTLYQGTYEVGNEDNQNVIGMNLKHAEMILWKRYIEDTDLQHLYDTMDKNNIDLAPFKSTMKYLQVDGQDIHNKNIQGKVEYPSINKDKNGKEYIGTTSKIVPLGVNQLDGSKVITVDKRSYGQQLDVPVHTATQTKFGTQAKKIVLSNIHDDAEYGTPDKPLNGAQLKQQLNNAYSALSTKGLEELRSKFGYDPRTGRLDRDKVTTSIVENLRSNKVPNSVVDAIKNGTPYDAVGSIRNKVYQSINKLIQGRVADMNMPGGTGVQVSGFGKYKGIESVAKLGSVELYNKLSNSVGKLEVNIDKDGLKSWDTIVSISMFNHIIDQHPDLKGASFEIRRKWLLDNLNKIEVQGIMHRIPTQATSSIMAMKIRDVLPESMGDVVILPDEITTSTGGDFDIDKLFIFHHNYEVDKEGNMNKIEYNDSSDMESTHDRYLTYKKNLRGEKPMDYTDFKALPIEAQHSKEALQNHVLDLFKTILQSKNHIDETLAPLDAESLKNNCNEIGKVTGKIRDLKDLEYYSPSYASEMKQLYLAGKSNVGIAALARVDAVLSQILGYKVAYEDKDALGHIVDGNGKQVSTFGNLTSTVCNDGIVRNALDLNLKDHQFKDRDGNYVTDELSWLLSAFVDLEKDPYIMYANNSKYISNITTFMYRLGLGRYTEWYTGQPIVSLLDKWNSNYQSDNIDKEVYQPERRNQEGNTYHEVAPPREFKHYTKAEKYYRDILSANNIDEIFNGTVSRNGVWDFREGIKNDWSNKKPIPEHKYSISDSKESDLRWSVTNYKNNTLTLKKSSGKVDEKGKPILVDDTTINSPRKINQLAYTYKPEVVAYDQPTIKKMMELQRRVDMKDKTLTLDEVQKLAMNQLDALEHFKATEKLAKKVQEATLAGRADTGSIFNSLIDGKVNTRKIDDLQSPLKKDGIPQFKDKMNENTTFIGKVYKNHSELLHDIYHEHTIGNSKSFSSMEDAMVQNIGASSKDNLRKVTNDLYSSIALTWLKDNYIPKLERGESYIHDLFYGESSVAKRLSDLRYDITNGKLEVSDSERTLLTDFLKEKYLGEGEPQFIKGSSKLDKSTTEQFVNTWDEMLKSDNERIKKFAEDMLVHTMISTGMNSTIHGLTNILPLAHMNEMGYSEFNNQVMLDSNSHISDPEWQVRTMVDSYLSNSSNKDIVPRLLDSKYKTYRRSGDTIEFVSKKEGKRGMPLDPDDFGKLRVNTTNGDKKIMTGKDSETGDRTFLPFLSTFNKEAEKGKQLEIFALSDYDDNGNPIYRKVQPRGYWKEGYGIKELGGFDVVNKESSVDYDVIRKHLKQYVDPTMSSDTKIDEQGSEVDTTPVIESTIENTEGTLKNEVLPEVKSKDIGKVLDYMKELSVEERKSFRELRDKGMFNIDCK